MNPAENLMLRRLFLWEMLNFCDPAGVLKEVYNYGLQECARRRSISYSAMRLRHRATLISVALYMSMLGCTAGKAAPIPTPAPPQLPYCIDAKPVQYTVNDSPTVSHTSTAFSADGPICSCANKAVMVCP